MPNQNVLPEMIGVSRNCGFTLQLNNIIKEKLSEEDLEVFKRWLKIVEEENQIAVNLAKKMVRGF